MSSQIARLKAQLAEKNKAEADRQKEKDDIINQGHGAHLAHLSINRSQAEKERIQAETAKKMASRFNLTYRALALSAAKKTAENRKRDMEAAKAAKDAAAKYQMTARSLQLSSTGTASGKVNVLNHVDGGSHYSVKLTTDDLLEGGMYSRDSSSAASAVFTSFQDLSSLSVSSTVPEPPSSASFQDLSSLAPASTEEDITATTTPTAEDSKNDMVDAVRDFLQNHDPSRVSEAESLAREYEGREDLLLAELHQQYPEVVVVE